MATPTRRPTHTPVTLRTLARHPAVRVAAALAGGLAALNLIGYLLLLDPRVAAAAGTVIGLAAGIGVLRLMRRGLDGPRR